MGASLGGSGRLATLRSTFLSFANFGRAGGAAQLDTMDGNMWAKFCRETGLQNKRSLTPVQVDLIFSKVKDRGERRIDFEDFKDAVAMVAEMRRMSFAELTAIITAKGGPQNSGTMAQYNKFAEPENFTGSYAANLGLGVKLRRHADLDWKGRLTERPKVTAGLRASFAMFNQFGGGAHGATKMESRGFIKMLRNCAVLNKRFNDVAADIVFTKVKDRGERFIDIHDFALALSLVAEEKGTTYEELVAQICEVDEPSCSGTYGQYNRFYDDKSMFSGQHAAKFGIVKEENHFKRDSHSSWREGLALPADVPGLKACFNSFCVFGGGEPGAMDNVKFAKLCRDCGLLSKKFTMTDVDMVFVKVKKRSERKISYKDFRWTVFLIGEETGKGYEQIAEIIVRAGPKSSGTVAEYTRFHDDKESFTGFYAEKFGVSKPTKVRRHWKEGRDAPKPVKGVRATYQAFCFFAGGNGVDMNIKIWAKLVAETGLLGKKFNMTSADIVFAKVAEGRKLLGFKDFLWMITLASEEKGKTYEELCERVATHAPDAHGTKAQFTRLHDDKDTFTGAYGANLGIAARVREHRVWKEGRVKPRSVDGMEDVYDAFCTVNGGKPGRMDLLEWQRLCEDCGFFEPDKGRHFSPDQADAIFSKVCETQAKDCGYVDFRWLLDLSAEAKGVSYARLCKAVLRSGGPR